MTESTQLTDLLRKRNLKATSNRLDVLAIIAESENAVPYSQIQDTLQNFDRVTLYRTLHVLIEKGIVHKAMVDDNETYYALCSHNCSTESHNHQHIHFKCNSCTEVMCLQVSSPFSIDIKDHFIEHLEISATGVCQKCQDKEANE